MSRNEGMKKGREGGSGRAEPSRLDYLFYQYSVVTPCVESYVYIHP